MQISLIAGICSLIVAATPLKMSDCLVDALGMESGSIKDFQLSASSSFDALSVGPQNARIRKELFSGAWCPRSQITSDSYEFLQIDLGGTYVITAVETQGRYGNGTGKEYTPQFAIDYMRSGTQWIRYLLLNDSQFISGNEDTSTAVKRSLDPLLFASKIRFIPYSKHSRTICLRIELYGCKYTEGLMFYSMSHDGCGTENFDFIDRIFEKIQTENGLATRKKGFGLLTDGKKGISNPLDVNTSTYNRSLWIGWNQSATNGSVELSFEFDNIRKFSFVELWTFGTSLKTTEITFSSNGRIFPLVSSQISSIQRKVKSDSESYLVPVRIPLHNRRAIAIKMKLNFESNWLFLSEVYFSSVLVSEAIFPSNPSMTYSVHNNSVVLSTQDQISFVFSAIFFIGLIAIFLFLACAVCGFMAARRHFPLQTKRFQKSRLIMSNAQKCKFYTSVYDGSGDFKQLGEQFENQYFRRKALILSGHKERLPSWSDFHFPPPPPPPLPLHTQIRLDSSAEPLLNMEQLDKESSGPSSSQETWPQRNEDIALHHSNSNIKSKCQLSTLDEHKTKQGNELGQGRFTIIKLATVENKVCAVKKLKNDCIQARQILKDEAQILSKCNSPNIIKFHATDVDHSLYLEYLQYGNIRQFLQSQDKIRYEDAIKFILDITSGMRYLERKKFIHGHLSPQCVLVGLNLQAKIAAPRGASHHAQLRYSAPESIIADDWSNKSDAWSFAVTAWEIFGACRRIPFEGLSNSEIVSKAQQHYEGSQLVGF